MSHKQICQIALTEEELGEEELGELDQRIHQAKDHKIANGCASFYTNRKDTKTMSLLIFPK